MSFFAWGILGFLLFIVWVITVIDIVRSHLGAQRTAAWLLIVILLPFVGALGYWVLRKPTEHDAEIAQQMAHGAPRQSGERPRPGA